MEKTLIILRGVSGAGKSTVVDLFQDGKTPHFEADMYHYVSGVYDWKAENQHKAHKWCQDQVRRSMIVGYDKVIVSNTSTTEKELKPYVALAEEFGYRVVSLVVEHRHSGENIHSVPVATLDRQEANLRGSLKLR